VIDAFGLRRVRSALDERRDGSVLVNDRNIAASRGDSHELPNPYRLIEEPATRAGDSEARQASTDNATVRRA